LSLNHHNANHPFQKQTPFPLKMGQNQAKTCDESIDESYDYLEDLPKTSEEFVIVAKSDESDFDDGGEDTESSDSESDEDSEDASEPEDAPPLETEVVVVAVGNSHSLIRMAWDWF